MRLRDGGMMKGLRFGLPCLEKKKRLLLMFSSWTILFGSFSEVYRVPGGIFNPRKS